MEASAHRVECGIDDSVGAGERFLRFRERLMPMDVAKRNLYGTPTKASELHFFKSTCGQFSAQAPFECSK